MAWSIKCCDEKCAKKTWATNIVDLIENHCDEQGWFCCNYCGNAGYIEKSFKLQERGETWEPYLKGIIRLSDDSGDTYQPFVFLVSYQPDKDPTDVWFSYYKDTRSAPGGRLKLGYGPGGPPVLTAEKVVELVKKMIERGCLDKTEVIKTIRSIAGKD